VTLTNNGQSPFTVAGIDTAGAAALEFSVAQTSCLGGPLVPGASCTVEVTFGPTIVGPRDAELVITDDTTGPPLILPLVGSGLGPTMTFEPPGLAFESQQVGTFSPRQDALLRNTGNSPLDVSALTLSGDFRFDQSCAFPLGPGGFCRIRVIFLPTATGLRIGEVRAIDDVGNSQALHLEGFGSAPRASLSSDSIVFSEQALGSASGTQAIRLTNAGTGVLVVTDAGVELGNQSDFVADGGDCTGAVLRQAESCTFGVTFAPAHLGPCSDTLRIVTNASDSPHNIRLSGVGIWPPDTFAGCATVRLRASAQVSGARRPRTYASVHRRPRRVAV
jgi:hypothetical protein